MDQRYRPNGAGYVIMPYLSGGDGAGVIVRRHVLDDVICWIYYAPLGLGGVLIVAFLHGLQPWLFMPHPWCLYADDYPSLRKGRHKACPYIADGCCRENLCRCGDVRL